MSFGRKRAEKLADTKLPRFDSVMLPHLDAAYNFARWLTRNDQDAQDVSQEAFMRAFEFFDGFKGGDPRPWLLTIVRNTFYTWLRKNRASDVQEFDEELHTSPSELSDPATAALRKHDSATLRQALDGLPGAAREILVLREMEDLA